jgi:hypothetical protein
MDYDVVNGSALNQGHYSNALIDLAGTTGITLNASEVQMEQMPTVSTGITLGATGNMAVLGVFSQGTTGITFNVTATDKLYVENYLSGDTGLSFSLVGTLINNVGLAGDTGITLDAASDLSVRIECAGTTEITFNISGDLYAKIAFFGQSSLEFTVVGQLWVNPLAAEDDDRTFRRPMLVKEFRRQ